MRKEFSTIALHLDDRIPLAIDKHLIVDGAELNKVR